MKPLSLNLSQMKKIHGDEHSSTFLHPGGHKMVIAHRGISALQRKQIESLPMHAMAEGGSVERKPEPQPTSQPGDKKKTIGQIIHYPGFAEGGGVTGVSEESDSAARQGGEIPPAPVVSAPVPVPPMMDTGAGVPAYSGSEYSTDTPPAPAEAPAPPAETPPAASPEAPPVAQISQPSPIGSPSAMVDLAAAYGQGQRAISEQEKVAKDQAKANADIQAKDLLDRQALDQEFQKSYQDFSNHQQQLMKDFAADHINPTHYVENMGSAERVSTAIGLFLGGFSSAFTHGGNPAMEFLNKQIDRDIQAQQSNMDKKKTLLGANQAMFHDQQLAINQTRVNMNDIYDHKIQLAASKLGTPQAKAQADMAHAKFAMENSELLRTSAMRSAALKAAGGGQMDPAKLVPFLVPKEHQAKVFEEIKLAENIRHITPQIMAAFKMGSSRNPIIAAQGQREFEGLINTTITETEGTARQAAFDSVHNTMTPSGLSAGIGENKAKERTFLEYLQSKSSAPTARGYGIDLGKYQSTAPFKGDGGGSLEGKTATNPKTGQRVVMKSGQWVPVGG